MFGAFYFGEREMQIVAMLGLMFFLFCLSFIFIMIGWSLFIVPVFGLPSLTFIQAIGFALLTGAFRGSGVSKN